MLTKWLQERHNGSKNDTGIRFEGPGVDPAVGQKEAARAGAHRKRSLEPGVQGSGFRVQG